jgi:hypothetical protein
VIVSIDYVMKIKILFILMICGTVCFAQSPQKKTDLTVADREAWQKVLRWPVELEEQWRRSRTTNDREQSGLVFHSLGQGKYLVQIEVHESSYQPHYLFMYYAEAGQSRLLEFKTYERNKAGEISSKVATEVAGIPTFDAAKKQLVFLTKGRGTEDCGSIVTYKITRTGAIPTEARAHACHNDYSLGVTDPVRWEKVKRL